MMHDRKIIRRMGYVRDQDGIMNRYIREKPHWDPHLLKTRQFISSSFKGIQLESIAILGSGWLLDIPLDDLIGRFRTIYLVDILHPPQIRKKVANLEQVTLVETDLTGSAINRLWQILAHQKNSSVAEIMASIKLVPPLDQFNPQAIISVNLLNQLDIILCDFLARKIHVNLEQLTPFRKLIQDFHLEWITRTPGCLVTDTAEFNTDQKGNERMKSLLYTQLPDGHRKAQWYWEFDTHGSYLPGSLTRMEVQAIEWS